MNYELILLCLSPEAYSYSSPFGLKDTKLDNDL